MKICQHCGHENLEGVVFCDKCGIALVPVPLSTRQLIGDTSQIGGSDTLGPEGVVVFQVAGHETPITVRVQHEVILGRTTDQGPGKTFINLTPFDADEHGVSRQHARLLRDNQALYLMDLNSTNGTSLNGESIPAAVERRLRDGDEIMLGRLKMYVYLTH
ncbi:MAG: FHA domain-containing protein [Anaerolineae bacterium]|nr:FHA domain-containing protein [Anaerolineae bacterium]